MQRTILAIGLTTLLLTAFAGTAVGGHICDRECCSKYEPAVYVHEADTGISEGSRGETVVTVAGTAYVDVRRVNQDGYLYDAWIYLESNGEDGYQPEDCGNNGSGDTVIF